MSNEVKTKEKVDMDPKYIITLDDYFVADHGGVKTINAIDFLLGEEI